MGSRAGYRIRAWRPHERAIGHVSWPRHWGEQAHRQTMGIRDIGREGQLLASGLPGAGASYRIWTTG